jgi:hypothetical protein
LLQNLWTVRSRWQIKARCCTVSLNFQLFQTHK